MPHCALRACLWIATLLLLALSTRALAAADVPQPSPPAHYLLQVDRQIVQRIASPFVDAEAAKRMAGDSFAREYELQGLQVSHTDTESQGKQSNTLSAVSTHLLALWSLWSVQPNRGYEVRLSYIGTVRANTQ